MEVHSFLKENTTKKLGCRLVSTQPLSVTVANGSKVINKSSCIGFQWEMHGERFATDLRLLKLGGCDIVLGVDWMKTVSPISFDFNKLEVTFEKHGRKLTLAGSLDTRICKIIIEKKLQKMFKSKQVAYLFSMQAIDEMEAS